MKQTMDKQDDRLLREALGRRADRVPALSDDFEERVLAKLQAHAASPKPLSISPQEPLSISPRGGEGLSFMAHGAIPQKTEGEGLRHGGWRTWAWVASVAAAVVIGFFVFHGKYGTNGIDGTNGSTTDQVAVVPDSQGVNVAPSQALQRTTEPFLAESPQSSPSLQGRAGGGSSIATSPSPQGLQGVGVPGSPPSPRGGQGKGSRANGASSIAISPSPRGGQGEGVSATAPTLADLYAAIDQMTNEAIEEADRLMAEALVREYTDDEPS